MSHTLLWFRQDLRLQDNPVIEQALKLNFPLTCVYILDDETSEIWKMGGASRWWLHHSLYALKKDLSALNLELYFYKGNAGQVILNLVKDYGFEHVLWNRCYEPFAIERDKALKQSLKEQGITATSFQGTLLKEPHTIFTKEHKPYRVFTPFWKAFKIMGVEQSQLIYKVEDLKGKQGYPLKGEALEDLNLLPEISWDSEFQEQWIPGEVGAHERLESFLKEGLAQYHKDRDVPGQEHGTSKLSPHLHFGEISPMRIWREVHEEMHRQGEVCFSGAETFLSELGWREFSYYLLYHFPNLPDHAFQEKFTNFPWYENHEALKRWQQGMTGIPIIDAGMRQLWRHGWMHNRVRMIVASFLTKNLLIGWQEGEKWFWDCLVDADLASNSASWQWVAGSGADAQPYFRIFNPITQGHKFDPKGVYVRTFVPELKALPDKYIHAPWEASEAVLKSAGVILGKSYPHPIVDLKHSRARALAAYAEIK